MRSSRRMQSIVGGLVVVGALLLGLSGSALAEKAAPGASNVSVDDHPDARRAGESRRVAAEQRRGKKAKKPKKGHPVPHAEVPELDPNAAGLALALLAGGAMLFVDRRRFQQV